MNEHEQKNIIIILFVEYKYFILLVSLKITKAYTLEPLLRKSNAYILILTISAFN